MTTDTPPTRQTMNGKPVFEVPAKSVINMESGFKEKLLCDGPTFSTGSACAYSCKFCYVPTMMTKNPHWQAIKGQAPGGLFENVVIRRKGALESMRQQLLTRGKPRFPDINDKRVIYASPLVDVAANMDLVRETVEACTLVLSLTHWHIRLLSKSNMLPQVARGLMRAANDSKGAFTVDDVVKRLIFGVSTGTLDDNLAKAFEEGTPKVSKRIESLHWLQDEGFRTFGMLCPSLPQRDYSTFGIELAEAIRWRKCEHVWSEVLNVRGDSMKLTCAALRKAGYEWEAAELEAVASSREQWEEYSRATFFAHRHVYDGSEKLRFLQYTTQKTEAFWKDQASHGAILL